MVRKAATKAGKPKTSFIVETVERGIGSPKSREQLVREMAGWMTHQEAEELREAVKVFDRIPY